MEDFIFNFVAFLQNMNFTNNENSTQEFYQDNIFNISKSDVEKKKYSHSLDIYSILKDTKVSFDHIHPEIKKF